MVHIGPRAEEPRDAPLGKQSGGTLQSAKFGALQIQLEKKHVRRRRRQLDVKSRRRNLYLLGVDWMVLGAAAAVDSALLRVSGDLKCGHPGSTCQSFAQKIGARTKASKLRSGLLAVCR